MVTDLDAGDSEGGNLGIGESLLLVMLGNWAAVTLGVTGVLRTQLRELETG